MFMSRVPFASAQPLSFRGPNNTHQYGGQSAMGGESGMFGKFGEKEAGFYSAGSSCPRFGE